MGGRVCVGRVAVVRVDRAGGAWRRGGARALFCFPLCAVWL